ncbi:MAG: hypothetical protein B6242_05560 [Anaerolineaceae bacterium 4572_78]|nr:MAG: hypothetical protein B6242_05560 [Anaerolineaceae bacterium 4572_78]
MEQCPAKKNISLSDPLQVMRQAGFQHILRLAMALSFRFIANANGGKQPWMKEDRRTLIEYISETLETGDAINVGSHERDVASSFAW